MRVIHWVGLILLMGVASCDGDPAGPAEEGALWLAPNEDVRLAQLEMGSFSFAETLEYPDTVRVEEPFEVRFEVWLDGALRLDRDDALTVGREVVFLTYGRNVGEGPPGRSTGMSDMSSSSINPADTSSSLSGVIRRCTAGWSPWSDRRIAGHRWIVGWSPGVTVSPPALMPYLLS